MSVHESSNWVAADAGKASRLLSTDAESDAPATDLQGMGYPDRRTSLLIHAALTRSGCDEATIRRVHQSLADAGAVPMLTRLRRHCGYIFAHSLKTTKLVVHVARDTGIDGSEHAVLALGALLHDIGKLAVPPSLLNATRRLRKTEIDAIRSHSEIGYDSLSDTRIIGWNAVLDVIRHHHERLDGSGYPFGLTAPDISWRTRCVTACDVFSALIESRPYRPALSRDEAFAVLSQMVAAGKIDGDIVDALRRWRPE